MAVGAGAVWGLAFVLPQSLTQVSTLGLVTGRYLVYGLLSAVLVIPRWKRLRWLMDRSAVLTALAFAFAGNIGNYYLLAWGISRLGAPVGAATIACLPVTAALYGNWRRREFPFRRLLAPIVLTLGGLALINVKPLSQAGGSGSGPSRLLALACLLAALALWTWFTVHNAEFLKTRTGFSAAGWSTCVGVGTLPFAVVAVVVMGLSGLGSPVAHGHRGLLALVLGSLVLGIPTTWGGAALWNRASALLPVSLSGQLIVLQTVMGFAYTCAFVVRWPALLEIAGFALLLVALPLAVRKMRE